MRMSEAHHVSRTVMYELPTPNAASPGTKRPAVYGNWVLSETQWRVKSVVDTAVHAFPTCRFATEYSS
jgi:hypothetical protein